ncbi:MAG TPA: T9SS type A sorting domain-containing protein [Bacteroidales bacterium]|nr:T9SS type A sorting domain-containing protein [Bacteroidales bacterium]
MKKIFILFAAILVLSAISAHSQSFVKDLKTTEDEICIGFAENPAGGYFISILRGAYQENDPALLSYRNIIYNMDVQGNLADSIVFEDNDSLRYLGGSLLLNGNELIVTSSVYSNGEANHNLALRVTRLNFDLDVTNDVLYNKPGYYLNAGAAAINGNGNLVMAIHPQLIATGEWYAAALELTPDGDVVREQASGEFLPSGTVIPFDGGNGYLFTDLSMIVSLDENLNYQEMLYQHQDNDPLWSAMSSFKAVSDHECLVTGWKPWDPFDAAWAILDKNGTWQEQHSFGMNGYSDHAGGADFVRTDNIYISRAVEMAGYTDWSLYNFKLDGTENWHHDYTYNGYHFAGFGACATSDNSCVLIGRYQTENSGWNEYDLVFMKLNEDGSVTGIGEPGNAKTNVSLYPNPGNDKLNVNGTVAGCQLSIFDNAGRLVFSKTLESNNATINVCELLPGFYTYCIDSKNETIAYGKWVKK